MTHKPIAPTQADSARIRTRALRPLLTLTLAGLTACAQPIAEPANPAPESSRAIATSVDAAAKGQQPVGYDVQELERRVVNLLVTLDGFDDVQPRSVAKAFGLKLRPRVKQPLSLEGVGRLSNGWVFDVWAWQSEPDAPPQAPLQVFFYPGGAIDPGLWVDSPCFVDIAGILAQLRAAGYAKTGEFSNFPIHSFELVRTAPKAEFTVRVGDYRMLRGPLEGTRCLSDLTVSARPPSQPQ
ncbi:hypothetical protein [Lysobacter enzymogenes]|uniref:hypothetical protein n=1 Tax=Lysobacter enzymogenes TaxID=69 RepID=UPI0019D01D80|nr:hypothetical protein [Lysobacter enzymogenes]